MKTHNIFKTTQTLFLKSSIYGSVWSKTTFKKAVCGNRALSLTYSMLSQKTISNKKTRAFICKHVIMVGNKDNR